MSFLSSSERTSLLSQHKAERDGRIKDRLKVVLLYNDGESFDTIGKFLLIHPETAKRHFKEFKSETKLKPSNGGSAAKLSDNQAKELLNHLNANTYTKVHDIKDYVLKIYGVQYSNSGLTKWLHDNDFVYKKPKGIPAKLDPEAQKKFIEIYQDLEKNLPDTEDILFMDSCHPTQSTKLDYGWIKKGKEKQVKTTASRTRMNITGAVNIKTREVISSSYDKIDGSSTIDFLEKISRNYSNSKKVHVILDGASYHKSKLVQDFIEGKNIKLHILPPYSPNLNPIERLWKLMNKYVRNNTYFENAKQFRDAVIAFLNDTIPRIKDELVKLINSNFQSIQITS